MQTGLVIAQHGPHRFKEDVRVFLNTVKQLISLAAAAIDGNRNVRRYMNRLIFSYRLAAQEKARVLVRSAINRGRAIPLTRKNIQLGFIGKCLFMRR
ncbi:MAG: hypothetical protein ABI977_03180 [Acidobacteriota bacterium]